MVDYLVDDVGLAEIRSKESSESQIEETSDGTKGFIKWFCRLFPPGIILLFGAFKLTQRRNRKKSLQVKS
jgi:hypothetical protein